MFGKKTVSEEFNGFLAEGTSLTGDLHFSGTLHLNGNVRGSITTADVLIIGESATVEAEIKAGEIQVYGRVIGNIDSSRKVEICEGGSIHGDVRTAKFIIKEGGTFEGMSLSPSTGEALPLLPEDWQDADSASIEIPELTTS